MMTTAPTTPQILAVLSLMEQGKNDRARQAARNLTQRYPKHLFGWKALAATFASEQQWQKAIDLYHRVFTLGQHDWEFHNNFANALKAVDRTDDAQSHYEQAIELGPYTVAPRYNLALIHIERGQSKTAEQHLLQVLKLEGNHAETHLNLADLYNVQNRVAEADFHYMVALALLPLDAKIANNLGRLRSRQQRYVEAEGLFRKALELDPAYTLSYNNLSDLLLTHGYVPEAIALLREALAHDPENAAIHSNLLFTLAGTDLSPEELLAEHKAFARHFETPLLAMSLPHSNTPDCERPLRIGFVSADLRNHPLIRYLMPTLKQLLHYSELTLFAYHSLPFEDADTQRYKQRFHHWRDVFSITDSELAALIRKDGIDILIDLSGHTGGNRLLALAYKPAPIQISWMGYVGTTAMNCIDYVLSDEHLVPAELLDQFTETVLRIPCTTPFEPLATAPEVNELPALSSGVFTFASISRANKLNAPLIELWSRILHQSPRSRLVLATLPNGEPPPLVMPWFAQNSIGADRIAFVTIGSTEHMLPFYQSIDLALDTIPYGGSTTNNHALWMGVPTLTIAGSTAAGRMGVALAQHTGLEQFIANDADDYVRKAVELSRDISILAKLRPTLRSRLANSIVTDAETITTSLVGTLKEAWRRWCSNQIEQI